MRRVTGAAWPRRRLVLLVAFAGVMCAQTAPALADCPDIQIIGVRGSGETAGVFTDDSARLPSYGMGPSVWHMADTLSRDLNAADITTRHDFLYYPAAGVGILVPHRAKEWAAVAAGGLGYYYAAYAKPYLKSINSGRDKLVTMLRDQVADCPDTGIVLAGYSQGAIVIHQAEQVLADPGDEDTLDTIEGTLLLADGDRIASTHAKHFGTASNASGVRTYLHGLKHPRDVVDPGYTADICDSRDLVCDFNLKRLMKERGFGKAAKNHTTYLAKRKNLLDQAAHWLAAKMIGTS